MTIENASSRSENTPKKGFASIARRFERNINALRVFVERIGTVANEHDQATMEAFTSAVARHLGNSSDNPNGGDREGAAADDSAPEESPPPNEQLEKDKARIGEIFSDPVRRRDLMGAMAKFVRMPPVQGSILRNGALVMVVSYFEAQVSDVIHFFYRKYPEALPADERLLSLADLRDFGSLEEAEDSILTREVDTVLRQSLTDQLGYLGKRPKLHLDSLKPLLPTLVEIGLRRNLLVHNQGIVNRTYLAKVDASLLGDEESQVGHTLRVDEEYLHSALDTIFFAGAVILQCAWRKWEESSLVDADGWFDTITYEGLRDERYDLVLRLSAAFRTFTGATDASSRIVLINRAIAFRELGMVDEIEQELSTMDWTAVSPKFQVALAVLRNEEDRVYDLLKRAVTSGEIDEDALLDWPLFKPIRNSARFQAEIAAHFPEAEPSPKDQETES